MKRRKKKFPSRENSRSGPTNPAALATAEVVSTPKEEENSEKSMHEQETERNEPPETEEEDAEEKPADEAGEEPTNREEGVETSQPDQEREEKDSTPLKSKLRSSRATDQVADPAEGPKDSPSKAQPNASILPEPEKADGEPEEPQEEDIDEAAYHQERKRKRKMPAQPVKKKARKVNTTVVIQKPIRVSFGQPTSEGEETSDSEKTSSGEMYYMSEEIQNPDDAVFLVDEVESLERIAYEKFFMDLDNGLLEEMQKLEDLKLQTTFNQKDSKTKDMKSGKMMHLPSLSEIAARAREFFTSFGFRITTDFDEISVRFRVFGMELEMSLTEWTMRMGIFTLEQALSAEWRDRERGIPNRHFAFDAQVPWESLTHPHSKKYQATKSKSYHFSNPILRLAQVYLAYNLLGQITPSDSQGKRKQPP